MLFCFFHALFCSGFGSLLHLETLNETERRLHVLKHLPQLLQLRLLILNLLSPHVDVPSEHLGLGEDVLHDEAQLALPLQGGVLRLQVEPEVVRRLVFELFQVELESTFEVVGSKVVSIKDSYFHDFLASFNIKGKHFIPYRIQLLPDIVRFLRLPSKSQHHIRIRFPSDIHRSQFSAFYHTN